MHPLFQEDRHSVNPQPPSCRSWPAWLTLFVIFDSKRPTRYLHVAERCMQPCHKDCPTDRKMYQKNQWLTNITHGTIPDSRGKHVAAVTRGHAPGIIACRNDPSRGAPGFPLPGNQASPAAHRGCRDHSDMTLSGTGTRCSCHARLVHWR